MFILKHIRTLRVPSGSMKALSWEGRSLRIAIAIESFIYFANVKPDHKYAFYGNTLAYCSGPETVTFWDTITHQVIKCTVPLLTKLFVPTYVTDSHTVCELWIIFTSVLRN